MRRQRRFPETATGGKEQQRSASWGGMLRCCRYFGLGTQHLRFSPLHRVTASPCRRVAVAPCRRCTVSPRHRVTVSPCPRVPVSPCQLFPRREMPGQKPANRWDWRKWKCNKHWFTRGLRMIGGARTKPGNRGYSGAWGTNRRQLQGRHSYARNSISRNGHRLVYPLSHVGMPRTSIFSAIAPQMLCLLALCWTVSRHQPGSHYHTKYRRPRTYILPPLSEKPVGRVSHFARLAIQ